MCLISGREKDGTDRLLEISEKGKLKLIIMMVNYKICASELDGSNAQNYRWYHSEEVNIISVERSI